MPNGALPTLWFLHATGCDACAAARPVVARWLKEHPGRVVPRALDLAKTEWRAKSWEPELTPTFLVRFPDGGLSERLEGIGTAADFDAWMQKVLHRR